MSIRREPTCRTARACIRVLASALPAAGRCADPLLSIFPLPFFSQFTFAGIERNKNPLAEFRTRLVCVDSLLVAARRAAAAWGLAQKRMPDSDVVANNHHDEEVLVSDAESVPDSDGEESKARGKTGRLGTVRCTRARMRAAAPTAGRPGSQGPWSGPMRLRGQVGPRVGWRLVWAAPTLAPARCVALTLLGMVAQAGSGRTQIRKA